MAEGDGQSQSPAERKMLRTRLMWFGIGFAMSGVAVSQLVYRDLLVDRHAFVAEMNGKFDELEARVRNIEARLLRLREAAQWQVLKKHSLCCLSFHRFVPLFRRFGLSLRSSLGSGIQ